VHVAWSPSVVQLGDPDGSAVTLSDPYRDGSDFVIFTLAMTGQGLSARSLVRSLETGGGLATFVKSLAESWEGWEGTRTWHSAENDLSIGATSDPLGHVRLAITLRESYQPESWAATCVVLAEAGEEMKRVSDAVGSFLAL
jgi:hypothetical protein